MPIRVILVSADPAQSGELEREVARLGGAAVNTLPDELDDRVDDLRLPHVIILDGRDSRVAIGELCEAIRGRRRLRSMPILAVVSQTQVGQLAAQDRVDDFIVAPYSQAELRARLGRLFGRLDHAPSAGAIKVGQVVLDPATYDVTVSGARVDLTLKEYDLLKHLMTHAGRVFTRDQLLNCIWGYDYLGGTRTVDVHIRRLRAKLGDAGETAINTIRGVGYCFRFPQPRQQPDI